MTLGVAAYVRMVISVVVPHGKGIVDILDDRESRGRHGEGEDGEEGGELHFGWVKRVALEVELVVLFFWWLGLRCLVGLLGTTWSPEWRRGREFI